MKVAASPRPRIVEPLRQLHVRPFGYTILIWPLLTSGNPSESLAEPLVSRQVSRPPRVRIAAFTPPPPHLLHHLLMATGFALTRKLTPMIQPDMRFVFLGPELCLRLPSDSTSRWTPLPSANSFHHQDLQGTSTPMQLSMPGTRKLPPTLSVAFKMRQAYGQCPSPCLIRIETAILKYCSPTLLVHLRCGASAPTPHH